MTQTFNPEMLKLARMLRGLTQKELAEMLDIRPGVISKYETGIDVPSEIAITGFSVALKFPMGFFYRDGKLHDVEFACGG